jgi:hypothetical protein
MCTLLQTVATKSKPLSTNTAPLRKITFEFQPDLQPQQFFFLWFYDQSPDHTLQHTYFCNFMFEVNWSVNPYYPMA